MGKLPQISTYQIYPEKFPGLLASLENWPFQGYHCETKKWRVGHKAYYLLDQV